jgi:hypothetical protein
VTGSSNLSNLTVSGSSNLQGTTQLTNVLLDTLTVLQTANIANLIVPGYSNLYGDVTAFGNVSAATYLQNNSPNIEFINLHLLGNLIVDINTTVSNLTDDVMFTREINFEPGAAPPAVFQGTIIDSPTVSGSPSFGIAARYSLILANASVSSSTNTFTFTVTDVPGTLCLAQANLTYTTSGGVASYAAVSQTGVHEYEVTFVAPAGNFETSDRMYILVNFTQYA